VRVIAEDGKRRRGSSGGGGRIGLAYFDGKSPEWHAGEAVRQALTMLDAREAPAGEMEVVLAPGDSGILLHEAVGHGLEADFNRKKTSNYTDQVGQRVASELCTVVDDATIPHSRGSINVDDEGNVPELGRAHREGHRSAATCRIDRARSTSTCPSAATAAARASVASPCRA
jgi:TldD protein